MHHPGTDFWLRTRRLDGLMRQTEVVFFVYTNLNQSCLYYAKESLEKSYKV